MKRKLALMGVAGALVMTAIVGGSLAAINAQSDTSENVITTKSLGIGIYEAGMEAASFVVTAEKVMPGDTVEKPMCVKNDVEDGYELYVRVIINKSWGAYEAGQFAKDFEADTSAIALSRESTDWIVEYEDEEQMVLYYTRPLAAGEETSNFMDALAISEAIGNSYAGKAVQLEVEADAVQKFAGIDAMASAWGVTVTLDENGNITDVQ